MDQGDYFDTYEDADAEEPNCEELWKEEVSRKDADLLQWLLEFKESDEYADYVHRKTRRRNKKTQVNEELVDAVAKGSVLEAWLHKESARAKLKHAQSTQKCEPLADQSAGIDIIKEKMFEAKRRFLAEPYGKYSERDDRERIVKILKEEYGIELPWLTTKSKLVGRVISVRRKKAQALDRKRTNTLAIVEKLLRELKYEKARKERKEKVWDYGKSEGKFVEGLEIVGCKVTLHELPEPEAPFEEYAPEEEEILEVPVDEDLKKKKTKGKKKGDKKSKKKGKKDKSSKSKSKKDKKKGGKDKKKKKKGKSGKSKKGKKGKKEKKEVKISLPVPPIVNPRRKVQPENWEISKLLKDVDGLREYLKDEREYAMEKLMRDDLTHGEDHEMQVIPSKIIFKNFLNGNTYRMKVQLKNTSSYTKKLRFDKIIWNGDVDDDLLLEVEPLGIQKLLTGINISFHLRFNPETLEKSTEAKIVFLTYKPGTGNYRQYVLHVACTPHCSEIVVTPTIVLFEEMPVWRAKKSLKTGGKSKTLKVTNSGSKECKVVITKVHNPITVEHEWRNIISILSIDESSSAKITSSDLSLGDVSEDRFPRSLVHECVENAFNSFRFDRMCFIVPGNSEKSVKVSLRNIDESGYYVETYLLSVYERFPDNVLYCIGNQDLIVNAELSGHFLQLLPDLVDFEVCVYDSVYQLSFQVYNPSNLPHNLRIKFPASLKGYMSCSMSDITVQPGKYHTVHVKFTPRRDFSEYNLKFWDDNNDLYQFPVFVNVYTRHFEDTPPLVVDVFAVLTNPLGLVLLPNLGRHVSNVENEYLVDLGVCCINEAVYTEIRIQNNSLVPQQFGFLDLPECVSMHPNFGFGHLLPMQTKTLRLYFQPTKADLQKLPLDKYEPNTVLFGISANTVKNLGALKKSFDVKRLNKKLKQMETLVKNPPEQNRQLEEEIVTMCDILRSNPELLFAESGVEEEEEIAAKTNFTDKSTVSKTFSEKVLTVIRYDETSEMVIPEESLEEEELQARYASNRIWLKATIKRPLCEFSFQCVMFPETPCGSYSVAGVELRYLHGIKDCRAKFELFGNSDEIAVEPNYGELKQGEKINIYLIAKPEVPQHVIEEKALALKVAEAIEAKRREFEEKRKLKAAEAAKAKGKKAEKGKKAGKAKGKKDKKKGEKKSKKSQAESAEMSEVETDNVNVEREISLPEIVIDEKDIVYGYFDFFPAEMCVWRNLESYIIEADICCKINYRDEFTEYSTEKLFLKAKCRVVQPNFIHDLHLQEIDFGVVAVGMSRTKIVTLQNIQRKAIEPKINPLNPNGCFSTSEFGNISILPEYLLKIPITYTPQTEEEDNQDIEFFEIVCEQTTSPLILKGRGVFALLTFKPDFTVSRVDPKADCTFEIKNDTECPVEINFTKTLELDGTIQDNPATIAKKEPAGKKPSKKSKKDKSSKSTKSKSSKGSKKAKKDVAKKRPKFSDTLMDDEIYSLENLFSERNVDLPCLFRVVSGQNIGDTFEIPAMGKCVFKIKFGVMPEEKAGGKKGKKEKGKGKGKDKKSDKSSKKSSKKSDKKKKKGGGKVSYHVAKYAITLGKCEFLKEFIIVGCLSQ